MGTMPKKGTRRIVVDGRPYRWRLRPPPYDREEWMDPPPRPRSSVMVVQADADRPGRVCRVGISWRDDVPVTPEAVATVVRRCREAGWDPDAKGVPFDAPDVDVLSLETRDSVVRAVMGS